MLDKWTFYEKDLLTNCLSVFDHFAKLVLKGVSTPGPCIPTILVKKIGSFN